MIHNFLIMTSPNGNTFRVSGPLCGEFTGSPSNSPHRGHWRGALMFSLICAWINSWVDNRKAGDLRRHRAHYYVIVMICLKFRRWFQRWDNNICRTIFLVKHPAHVLIPLKCCQNFMVVLLPVMMIQELFCFCLLPNLKRYFVLESPTCYGGRMRSLALHI